MGFVGRRPCAPVGGIFLSVPDIVLANGVVAWDPDNVVSWNGLTLHVVGR